MIHHLQNDRYQESHAPAGLFDVYPVTPSMSTPMSMPQTLDKQYEHNHSYVQSARMVLQDHQSCR